MKIYEWHKGLTDKETADGAYWERNVLALRYADGWYNVDIEYREPDHPRYGAATFMDARFKGWRRVLSLDDGKITFHVPDDFDVGDLPQIEPNWDGHTTKEKWERVLRERGVKL